MSAQRAGDTRLVTFEVCGAAYALPIADVLEVADVSRLSCIPTLPLRLGGVMNLHGDALPVIERSALFDVVEGDLTRPEHLLVIGARHGEAAAQLGVPVDRVLGIVAGRAGAARDASGVVERRPIDGRVVSILDTRRLLERAAVAIQRAVDAADGRSEQGGSA